MVGLAGFTDKPQSSLEEFNTREVATQPVISAASNTNMAALTAAASNDMGVVADVYGSVGAELNSDGSSPTADNVISKAKQERFGKTRAELIEYLADPDVPQADKESASIGFLQSNAEAYGLQDVIAENALEDPVANESEEAEFVRINTAGAIQEVKDFRRQKQALLNMEVAKSSPSILSTVTGLAELMLPFAEQSLISEINEESPISSFFLMGSSKDELRNTFLKMPYSQRMEAIQKTLDLVNQNSTNITMLDENDFNKVHFLRTILEDGYFQEGDKWIDNIISVLDMTILGGIAARLVKGTAKAAKFATSGDHLADFIRSSVQPGSVSQVYKDTNPDKFKTLHEAALRDPTNETAQASYGTSREEAMFNDVAFEVANNEGRVTSKVSSPDSINNAERTPDADIMDFVDSDGAIYYWEQDKRDMRSLVKNDFQTAVGVTTRTEMFQVKNLPDGLNLKGIYGPRQGGWSDVSEAVDTVVRSLSSYGVDESNITVLKRSGDGYVPLGKGETSEDILVQVDYNYKFSPLDIPKLAEADVKYNIFDRVPMFNGESGAGSLQRHILDAHSMLHPNITLGANVAVDKAAALESRLLELGKGFADPISKMPKERQQLLERFIKEANEKNINFDYNKMIADGLRPSEIDALKSWKKFWDTHYELENRDLAKTLRARGFQQYVNPEADTRLFAKPLAKNSGNNFVYDPDTGSVRTLSIGEMDALYDQGGTVARLRAPIEVDGRLVENMVVGKVEGGYLRAINNNSQVLNYRRGYYTVYYKDPHFIVKKITDKNGNTYEKAIATSGNIRDAKQMVERFKKSDGGEYFHRRDVRKTRMDSDDYWDLQQAQGRVSQRVRGKRLEEANSYVESPEMNNILDPVDSMILSARSIANRVSMRSMLETNKVRFMQQYSEFLPKNKWGETVFPGKSSDIRKSGREFDKDVADARTTFEYIQYLENGYRNHIDDFGKAILKGTSDAFGNAGLVSGEKAASWFAEARGPSAMAKNLSFNLYLALNPLRQLIVQSHQAVQLAALFPSYVAKPNQMVAQVVNLTMGQMGMADKIPQGFLKQAGWTKEEYSRIYKQFSDSGLVANIDRQNLVNGALSDLADQVVRKELKPISFMRKIGFDAGENFNMMTAWLAHRDDAVRRGLDMNQETLDKVAGAARNFTYNMNFAGDMPYNQNALQVMFQFMQVPHKAATTMLTNRALSRQQRARLVAFNTVMFGGFVGTMANYVTDAIMPDASDETRQWIGQGLESIMLNSLIRATIGDNSNIDFSSLSPFDLTGTSEFLVNFLTTDAATMVAGSPAGNLLFGSDARFTEFLKTAARYTNVMDDYEDPTEFGEVALTFAKLSSGFSNAFKAGYIDAYKLKRSSTGGITDRNMTTPEALARMFGFQSMDEANRYLIGDKLYTESKDIEKDVKDWYASLKKHLNRKGITPEEIEFTVKVHSEFFRFVENGNPRAMQVLNKLITTDINKNQDYTMVNSIYRQLGVVDSSTLKDAVNRLPDATDKQRQELLSAIGLAESYTGED